MITEQVYNKYFSCLLAGNRAECSNIVKELLAGGIAIRDLYTELFQRSMYKIGELWEGNKISVATEHLATSITEGLFALIYPTLFSMAHTGRKAVIACVANEFHQLGAKMVADTFELNGWDSYFLGANTPADDLIRLIDEKKPDLVGLSSSIYSNMAVLSMTIEKIRTHYPQLDVLVGGQACRFHGADLVNQYSSVAYVPSLQELESLIANA